MRQRAKWAAWALFSVLMLAGCAPQEPPSGGAAEAMPLQYARQFTVEYRPDGCALITVAGEDRFLLVPEGGAEPEETGDAVVLRRPLTGLYLASSASMDSFDRLDALDAVALTGTAAENWSLPSVAEAMDRGRILYAGKYSAPDFELLVTKGCPLAIENTMIYHTPEIKEQLEELGIPVLVERSSYESHPLGRLEWIKLYGLLVGKEAEARAFFDRQAEIVQALQTGESTGKTAAFFYLTPGGSVSVRRSGDYVSRMIALAGGEYVFSDLGGEDALSTVNLQMEAFYARARDADVLLYNASIEGSLETVSQLVEKNSLLAEFQAVRSGNVWCTERNLYQQPSCAGDMIAEMNAIFTGAAEDRMTYFHRLR